MVPIVPCLESVLIPVIDQSHPEKCFSVCLTLTCEYFYRYSFYFTGSTHLLFICTYAFWVRAQSIWTNIYQLFHRFFSSLLGARFVTPLHVLMPGVKMSLFSYTLKKNWFIWLEPGAWILSTLATQFYVWSVHTIRRFVFEQCKAFHPCGLLHRCNP